MNWFASAALLLWPLIALWLYSRRSIAEAVLWTIVGGQLLLPEGATLKLLPGTPNLDKVSVPAAAAIAGCILFVPHLVRIWSRIGFAEILFLSCVIGPIVTSELNGDVIFAGGGTVLPSLGHYEALAVAIHQLIYLSPFLLGRSFLRELDQSTHILRVLVIGGLFYSLLMLFELRMGPQLHVWLYGYTPTDMDIDVR